MDVEHSLIWKAFGSGKFPDLVARGIEVEHFADPECRTLYEFGIEFLQHHAAPPTIEVVKEEFPRAKPTLSTSPLSYAIEKFLLKVKERMAVELVREYHTAIEDPEALIDIEVHALDMARRLAEIVPTPRAHRFSDAQTRIEDYKRREREGINHGIFMGIPSIDHETLGLQPHELCVVAGYMSTGKSTIMKWIAHNFWLQGKSSLFISLEEEGEAVLRKIDAMAAHIKYWSLKALELEVGDIESWKRIAEAAHKDRSDRDIIVRDDINNCSVDKVAAEMMRYKPHAVFVDYLELMTTPRSAGHQHWETIAYSGQGLKQLARLHKIPIISAAQLNRAGGKGEVDLSTVAHQSVGKHSDILLGLRQTEEMQDNQELDAILMKNRDGKRTRATLRFELEKMFIKEKGIEQLFPKRPKANESIIGPVRDKAKRLEVARTLEGKQNPWRERTRNAKHPPQPAKKTISARRPTKRS